MEEFLGFPIIYKYLYETLEEAKEFIYSEASDMEEIEPTIIFQLGDHNNKYVETIAFVNLDKFQRHEFIITVNNSIYEVVEKIIPISRFIEHCKWGELEKAKPVILYNKSLKHLASGFVTAIVQDQLEIVKFFVENKRVPHSVLFKSPLYSCVNNQSINCFKFLSDFYESEEEFLPYVLEQDSRLIFDYIITEQKLMDKVFTITEKDWKRIQRNMNNIQLLNTTMELFKSKYIQNIKLK